MTMKRTLIVVAVVLFFAACLMIGYCTGHADTMTAWVLCKPGAQVNVRLKASKTSEIVGRLECGDDIQIDGETRNGWIHVTGIGENGDGWIYCGFVVLEEPVPVFDNYVVVAKKRVACRRWCDGPQISGKLGWIYNGSEVSVFYTADGWAVTSRGYIRSEYLEYAP